MPPVAVLLAVIGSVRGSGGGGVPVGNSKQKSLTFKKKMSYFRETFLSFPPNHHPSGIEEELWEMGLVEGGHGNWKKEVGICGNIKKGQ